MSITRIIERTVSLDGLAWRESLPGLAYQGEQNAHQFIIHCTQDGSPVTLTGSVLLRFLRPDGIAVDVPGSVVDGAAVVTLSGNCYAVMGRAEITIFVTQDSATVAVYSANTAVTRTTSGEEISGGDIINLPELQERFEEMGEAIDAAEEAAANADNAVEYVAQTETSPAASAHAVGEYLIYNGTLYTATTAIASGDSLTVGTNIAAVADGLGGAVADLKNAVGELIYGVDEKFAVTPGAINKFPVLLVNGETYTVMNNTGVAITVILYKEDGTTKTISSQLNNGSAVTFIIDSEEYTQIGGFVNTGATGTFDIAGEYSIMKIEDDAESEITDIKNSLFNYLEASASAIASGWRLNEFDGFCSSNANYKMLKYNVVAGSFVKVISDDRFQFQTVASVPIGGTSNRVGTTYGAGTYILKVPETATYLIVSTPTSSAANVFYCVDKTEALEQVTKTDDVNVTASATKHENAFYNSNNQIYTNQSQWDYYTLPVSVGENYTINTVAGGTVRGWAFRDASSNQLAIASYSGDVVQMEYDNVVAPSGAVELIVNVKKVSGYAISIVKNNDLLLNENKIIYNGIALPVYLDSLNQESNILRGKTLVCCGDSITYGADMDSPGNVTPTIESYQYSAYTKQWTRWASNEPAAYGYQIAARNDMTFYNGGVSGACVQGSGGTSTVPGFSVADGEYTLLPDNIDYLTLFFGWNDTAFGSLGTINDTTNDSYYGGYNVVLPYLINKYPYTKIALIVPFGTDVGHRQAIRDLANKWGVACFDLYKEGAPLYYGKEPSVNVDADIVTANRAKFQANGAHPNYQGHYLISTMLEAFLRGI